MADSDKYTQNLVVRPKREAAQVNPETEEAFEESKELVRESVRKAATTNRAFVTWLGIFCYRLVKHVLISATRRVFGRKEQPSVSSPSKVRPPRPQSSTGRGAQTKRNAQTKKPASPR